MDAEKPTSVRRALLDLGVALAGAFVIYVLSIGPVCYIAIRAEVEIDGSGIGQLYGPLRWFMEATPAGSPLRKYLDWWAYHGKAHRNARNLKDNRRNER